MRNELIFSREEMMANYQNMNTIAIANALQYMQDKNSFAQTVQPTSYSKNPNISNNSNFNQNQPMSSNRGINSNFDQQNYQNRY